MSLTFEEAMKIIREAKALGVDEFHTDGLTVKFRKKEPEIKIQSHTPVSELSADDLVKPPPALDEYTADEILYYSTPYFDQLQAEKEARKNKIAGESI